MPDFIRRANIDHYLELLHDPDLATSKRAMMVKLLLEEEDKLGLYQEQLDFAEVRLAKCRDHVNRLAILRDGFAERSENRDRAELLLHNAKALQEIVHLFCHRMRARVNSGGI